MQSECCWQAGGTDCLSGWADLAAHHGIISLDFFEHGRTSRRGSLSASDSGSAGSSSSSSSGAPGAATLGPEFLLPQRGRRLQKALSIVREASEEGLLDEISTSQLETVHEEAEAEEGEEPACSAEQQADGEGDSSAGDHHATLAAAATAGEEAASASPGEASAAAATAAEAAAPQPECSSGSSSTACGMHRASDLLVAAAAAGLVPRPGDGCHLTLDGAAGSGSALLLHLDTIPFSIRYGAPGVWAAVHHLGRLALAGPGWHCLQLARQARPACPCSLPGLAFISSLYTALPSLSTGCLADADHLFWLHSYAVAGGLQRNVLTLEQIRQALAPASPGAPPLCFVAEIGGYPAAALLLQPVADSTTEQLGGQPARQGRQLQLLLAAVFPEMQERAQVLAALTNYAQQQLAADGTTLEVLQGALLVLPALHRLAPAVFDGAPANAVSADASAPLFAIASSPFATALDAIQASWLLHRIEHAPGLSLDGFVLAVSAHMQEFSASPLPAIAPLAAAPPDAAAVAAVVRAARRISQAWQDAGPAGAGAEEAAAEELVGEVMAVVTGFLDAAGFPSEWARLPGGAGVCLIYSLEC